MPSSVRLNWKGKEWQDRIAKVVRASIDVVLVLCVPAAKRETPVLTATAQGSIQMRPAKIMGLRIVGQWGSYDVNYFIWLEIGARGRPGGFMLRRAADRFYPTLAAVIKQRLNA